MFARLFPPSIRSVLRFFYGPQEPAIQKIPDEILIDVLFPYLELREILNLRKVHLMPVVLLCTKLNIVRVRYANGSTISPIMVWCGRGYYNLHRCLSHLYVRKLSKVDIEAYVFPRRVRCAQSRETNAIVIPGTPSTVR